MILKHLLKGECNYQQFLIIVSICSNMSYVELGELLSCIKCNN